MHCMNTYFYLVKYKIPHFKYPNKIVIYQRLEYAWDKKHNLATCTVFLFGHYRSRSWQSLKMSKALLEWIDSQDQPQEEAYRRKYKKDRPQG